MPCYILLVPGKSTCTTVGTSGYGKSTLLNQGIIALFYYLIQNIKSMD
jgi:ABC-type nitrate/sulfonate/bicarbonate transport system ATPase subunit